MLDKNTLLPIAHATASTKSQIVFTTVLGQFTLSNTRTGDAITVTCIGYKPYHSVVQALSVDTLRVYLEPNVVALKDVSIKARRSTKADSLRIRKEFSSVFAYKGKTIKDAFITRSPYVYIPNDYITSTNNATTLISVNLFSVLDLLNKSKAPVSKLQRTLLKDEEYNYVDQVFSKQKVTEITRLKGDSLQTFMDKYRPSAAHARSMSDYEMMIYIMKCDEEFVKQQPK